MRIAGRRWMLVGLVCLGFSGAASASLIYINTSSRGPGAAVQTYNLDGTFDSDVIVHCSSVSCGAGRDIAVDPLSGVVYYSNSEQDIYKISSNGSGNTLLIPGGAEYFDIDFVNQLIFAGDGFVYDFAGNELNHIGAEGTGIALDPLNEIVYFANEGVIRSIGYDGSGLSQVHSYGTGGDTVRLAFDPLSGTLFFYTRLSNADALIRSFDIGLGVEETLFTGFVARDLFWDEDSSHLYWTAVSAQFTDGIYRSALDGSGPQLVASSGRDPFGIAIGPSGSNQPPITNPVPEPSTTVLLALGLLGVGFARRRKD